MSKPLGKAVFRREMPQKTWRSPETAPGPKEGPPGRLVFKNRASRDRLGKARFRPEGGRSVR